MGMVNVNKPGGSGKQVLTYADCTYSSDVVTFPSGVTWGDIEQIIIGCRCNAYFGQLCIKRSSDGAIGYLTNDGSFNPISTPNDTATSISVYSAFFKNVADLIAILK